MKPLRNQDPYKVGLALIATIVVAGVLLVFASKLNFGKSDHEVQLAYTGGLRPGEAVEIRGVQVGKVTSVKLDTSDRDPKTGKPVVLVKFDMDSDIALGADTQASVKVATLLGTHYLEITPKGQGNLNGPIALVDSHGNYNTSEAYNLQDALDQGAVLVGGLKPDVISKALVTLADTFDASKTDIGPALQGVSGLSMLIEKRGDQIGGLLTAASAVAKELKQNSGDITVLMQQANLVLQEINGRQEAIKALLTQSVNLANTVTDLIKTSRADLKPALTSLDAVIKTLNGQAAQLQKGFDNLAPAVRYVANATGNGPWLDLWGKDPLLPADDVTGGRL